MFLTFGGLRLNRVRKNLVIDLDRRIFPAHHSPRT